MNTTFFQRRSQPNKSRQQDLQRRKAQKSAQHPEDEDTLHQPHSTHNLLSLHFNLRSTFSTPRSKGAASKLFEKMKIEGKRKETPKNNNARYQLHQVYPDTHLLHRGSEDTCTRSREGSELKPRWDRTIIPNMSGSLQLSLDSPCIQHLLSPASLATKRASHGMVGREVKRTGGKEEIEKEDWRGSGLKGLEQEINTREDIHDTTVASLKK